MSFYLGKDSSGSNIMHITRDVRSADVLASGVLNTTTFHSDLKYVNVTNHSAQILSGTLTVSTDLKTLMFLHPCIILTSLGLWIAPFEAYQQVENMYIGTWISGGNTMRLGYSSYDRYTDGRYYWRAHYYGSEIDGTCTVFVINNVNPDMYTPITTSGSGIHVGNNKLLIRDFDLLNTGFIQRTIINPYDPTFTAAGEIFQITNTDAAYNTIGVVTDSYSTKILRGDVLVLDSVLSSIMEYRYSADLYIARNEGNSTSYRTQTSTHVFPTSVTKGFCVVYLPGTDGVAALGTVLPIPFTGTLCTTHLVAFNVFYNVNILVSATSTALYVSTQVMAYVSVSFPAQTIHLHMFY